MQVVPKGKIVDVNNDETTPTMLKFEITGVGHGTNGQYPSSRTL